MKKYITRQVIFINVFVRTELQKMIDAESRNMRQSDFRTKFVRKSFREIDACLQFQFQFNLETLSSYNFTHREYISRALSFNQDL